jgi:hypothetical protein
MATLFGLAREATQMLDRPRITVRGFFICSCGKLHMKSGLVSTCPRCGANLRGRF